MQQSKKESVLMRNMHSVCSHFYASNTPLSVDRFHNHRNWPISVDLFHEWALLKCAKKVLLTEFTTFLKAFRLLFDVRIPYFQLTQGEKHKIR